MRVYIMRGAPGSGKSTWVKKILGPEVEVVSADHYFMQDGVYRFDAAKLPAAHDACLRAFTKVMKYGATRVLVVDNTNTKVFEIAPYYRLAEAYGHDVEIIWIVAPAEVCKARNTHGVPDATIDAMVNGVEALPPWWKVRVVVGGAS